MNDKPNFFDGRTLAAIAVVFAAWMGWQYYMQTKYPEAFKKIEQETLVESPQKAGTTQTSETVSGSNLAEGSQALPTASQATLSGTQPEIETVKESILSFDSPTLSFQVSSHGMGIQNIRLKKYTDRGGETIRLGAPEATQETFSTRFLGVNKEIPFELSMVDERTFLGRAKWGNLEIVKKIEVVASRYQLKTDIQVIGSNPSFIGISTSLLEEIVPVKGASFFTPQMERQDFFVESGDSSERVHIAEEDDMKTYANTTLVSVGSQYFTQAFVNKSEFLPELKVEILQKSKVAKGTLSYQNLQGGNFSVRYSGFLGPKDVEILRSVDAELDNVIDFGFFSWIAKYILWFLKTIHTYVGNWGVAVILLTLAVRLLVLPFNIMSYKSMKVMQVLQPQMKAIREKYKEDQARMNQEVMALMKSHKANPLGGCLPMLLQFPIFIALYQVLGHSIELYQVPFAFWIQDLSAKDPYYVLPVLMGLTLYFQQKITPNTMDPAQAKVLAFMPLLFSFFMLSLPSGLTLYMFINGLAGVLQQMYFLKFNQVEEPAKG
ncbi:MAG: membrane protein insertase YidC [Bdellovibrionales bacterium]|nr:membrane protein insertase YidC [Bdellovibrionales bacterium]